jgi:predicted lipoprotein with Yx(FWY)xxD motif
MRLSIKQTATAALAILVAGLVLAACGGGNGNDASSGNASSMSAGSGLVSVKTVDKTPVLANRQGRTLYSADVEQGGRIHCTSGCLSFWAPVHASSSQAKAAAANLNLDLGVVKRPDGADQLTFDGQPLYSFTQERPGQLTGNGFADDFGGTHFQWMAAATGSAQPSSASGSGYGASSAPSPY